MFRAFLCSRPRPPVSPPLPYTTLFRSRRRLAHARHLGRGALGVHPAHEELRPLGRSEEHTSELQSHSDLVCRLLLEKNTRAYPARAGPWWPATRIGRAHTVPCSSTLAP